MNRNLFFRSNVAIESDLRLFSYLLEDLHERRLGGFQRKITLADLHLECSW